MKRFARTKARPVSQPSRSAPRPQIDDFEPDPVEVLPPQVDAGPAPQGIPDHVWHTLQAAGEKAVSRLYQILAGSRFMQMAPTAQKALIELALNRAYGLPVRKSIEVHVDGADAIAASLAELDAQLPEMGQPVSSDPRPETRTSDAVCGAETHPTKRKPNMYDA